MAKEETKEVVIPVKKEQSFILLKNFETENKQYKKGDEFSHSSKEVIEYLKTNKYI